MRIIINTCLCCLLLGVFSCAQKSRSLEEGWIDLFNGKNLEGWDIKIKGHPLNENYGNTFRVEDGKMVVRYDQYDNWNDRYGHIFYKEPFSAYLLVVEYRFTGEQIEGGPGWAFRNSGAMLHAQPASTMLLEQEFPVSLEAQFLGGNGTDERTTGNLCTPGTNVVMNGELFTPHCVSSSSKTYHGDQWVHAEMLVLGDSVIRHIIEKDTVISYEKPQVDGRDKSFKEGLYKDKQPLKSGYIALQSESHPVAYRKVSLFNLEPYRNDPEALAEVLKALRERTTDN